MTRPPRLSGPRLETVALARKRAAAARSIIGGTDISPEEQIAVLKPLCRFLWGVLLRREGLDGLPDPDWLFDNLHVEAKAAVDPTFEAMLVLGARDRTFVEPCRRRDNDQPQRYLICFPNGEKRHVGEAELLAMAGLA